MYVSNVKAGLGEDRLQLDVSFDLHFISEYEKIDYFANIIMKFGMQEAWTHYANNTKYANKRKTKKFFKKVVKHLRVMIVVESLERIRQNEQNI